MTLKYNMLNWALETFCTVMVIIIINDVIVIVFILIMSCGTPLVYSLGIEDNRNDTKEVLMSRITALTKKNKKKIEPVTCFESNKLISLKVMKSKDDDGGSGDGRVDGVGAGGGVSGGMTGYVNDVVCDDV